MTGSLGKHSIMQDIKGKFRISDHRKRLGAAEMALYKFLEDRPVPEVCISLGEMVLCAASHQLDRALPGIKWIETTDCYQ